MHVCWFFTKKNLVPPSHSFFGTTVASAPYGGRDEESHTADERTSFCKAALPTGGEGGTEEEGDIGLIEGCDRKAPIWGGGGLPTEDMAQ